MHEDQTVSANTKESLLDGNYETGVTCTAPGVIVATFPERTQVTTITVRQADDNTYSVSPRTPPPPSACVLICCCFPHCVVTIRVRVQLIGHL